MCSALREDSKLFTTDWGGDCLAMWPLSSTLSAFRVLLIQFLAICVSIQRRDESRKQVSEPSAKEPGGFAWARPSHACIITATRQVTLDKINKYKKAEKRWLFPETLKLFSSFRALTGSKLAWQLAYRAIDEGEWKCGVSFREQSHCCSSLQSPGFYPRIYQLSFILFFLDACCLLSQSCIFFQIK